MGLTVPLKLAVLRRLVNSIAEADLMVSVDCIKNPSCNCRNR